MKRKFILLPITLTALTPIVSMVGCKDKPTPPEPEPEDDSKDCLTVTALEQSTFIIESPKLSPDPWFQPNIDYSFDDGSNWITYDYSQNNPITIEKGAKVIFRGDNPNGFDTQGGSLDSPNFAFTGSVELSGNVMSLLDNGACDLKTIPCERCFEGLFRTWQDCKENHAIKSIEHLSLPATNLKEDCYRSMFASQSNLVTSLETLPSTNLAPSCYQNMFTFCTSLKTAPYLPATTLTPLCYSLMFGENSSLKIRQMPLTCDEQTGLIFKYTNSFGIDEVAYMFTNISKSSEYKNATPEPGYSYYWYTE